MQFIPQYSVAVINAGDVTFIMCLGMNAGTLRSMNIIAEGAPPLLESVKKFCRCITRWLEVHLTLLAGKKPGRLDGTLTSFQLTPIECELVEEVLMDVIDEMSHWLND